MANNKIDDWEEVSIESETDDWEDVTTPEESLEPRLSSSMGAADVKAAEKILDITGAGKALTAAGNAITDSELVKKVGKGAKGLATSTLSKVGRLGAEDIGNISGNLDKYKQVKSAPGKLPREMAETATDLGIKAKTATKDLDVVMDADKVGGSREKFLEDITEKVSDSRLEPTEKRVKQSKDAEKVLKKADRDIVRLETKHEKRMNDLQNKLNEKETLLKEYKESKNKLVDAEVMKDNERQAIDRMIDDLKDEKIEYDDPKASKEINKDIDKLNRQKRKLGENLKDLKNEAKLEKVKDRKLAKQYAEEVAEIKSEMKDVGVQKKKDLNTLQDRLKAAKKNMETYKLKGKGMSEVNEKVMQGLERAIDHTTEMKGKDVKVAKEYADKFYGKDGDDVRKAVREYVVEKSPRAAEALETSTKAISDRENLMKLLGYSDLEVRDAGKTMSQPIMPKGESSSSLAKAMFTEKGAEGAGHTAKEQIERILRETGDADKLTDLELNKIAKLAQGDASVTDAYLAAKGLSPTAFKRVAADIGTKAQELGAQALGKVEGVMKTPLGKAAGKIAKGVGRTLPFVGAAFDYAEAGELGIEDELGKAAYVGVEQLNPLPVSTGQVYTGLKDLLKDAETTDLPKATATEVMGFLKDREGAQILADDLTSTQIPSVQRYAERLQNIQETSENDAEYERKMSLLTTEPAFRELVRRRVRRLKDGNGQED